MKVALILAVLAVAAPVDAGQTSRPAAAGAQVSDQRAEAYAQFLLARRFEDDEDIESAIGAYKRAMTLDPAAADIPADLADLMMRQNRVPEATTLAEQALKLDADNPAANRVLGMIYASAAQDARSSRERQRENLARSIAHMEKAAARPANGGMVDANIRAMLARLYVANGDNDKAIPVLAELVKQEPGWEDGAILLVEAYTAAGRSDEAINWLEQTAPDSPTLYATLGTLYERSRRWSDAASAYEKAPQFSRSSDIRVRFASMLLNAGGESNAVRARDVLRQTAAAARTPEERVLLLLSQAERATGDFDSAERTARRIVALNASSARGYVALAESLEERRRYQDVIEALAPAAVQFRSATNGTAALNLLLPHLAFAYQQVGQLEQAIATFEEARKLSPRDPALIGYLIQVHLTAKNFDTAAQLARQARAERPSDLRLARLEAQALTQAGRPEQGIALLEETLKLQAGNPEAHIALAQVYSDAKRGDQAVKVLRDAQVKFPDETDITFQLGAIYEQQKNYTEAETTFRQIIARQPDHAPALNYLGYMLADRGEKLAESVDFIRRALEIEPDNGSYLDSLGWAYFRVGKLDLAEENLRRAADQLVTNSVVQDHFGDVLFRVGKIDEAIAAWTRALEGDRDSIDAGEVDKKIRSAQQKLPRR